MTAALFTRIAITLGILAIASIAAAVVLVWAERNLPDEPDEHAELGFGAD